MFPNYYPLDSEKRKSWRSRHEIEAEARRYEEWRLLNSLPASEKPEPQEAPRQPSGLLALLRAPLRLIMNMFG